MDNSQTYATFGTRHRTKTNKQKQNTIEKINMVSNMDPHYKQPGLVLEHKMEQLYQNLKAIRMVTRVQVAE